MATDQLDATNKQIDAIIGRSLLGAESIAQEERETIVRRVVAKRRRPFPQLFEAIKPPILRLTEFLYLHFRDTLLSTWITGYDYVAKLFPNWLAKEFTTSIRQPPPPPNQPPLYSWFEDFGSELRFPLIEKAAERLAERNILTRQQWDNATEAAKRQAFFITEKISKDTIDSVRQALVNDLSEGVSLDTFRARVRENVNASPIGPAHLENVYRTNVQAAFRDGRESLASDPVVWAVFPYQSYDAIHDARTRHPHLWLEKLGLNGTNVYRRDDPFWDYFTAPWDYQCRCGSTVMTIEAAARAGVLEARRWLLTGQTPREPEHRLQAVLKEVQPNPNFGYRVGVLQSGRA